MKNHYPQIRRALAGKLWYVHEQKMEEMLTLLELRLSGGVAAPEVLKSIRATNQAAASRAQKARAGSGSIAVIPIYGMIMHRQMADISGGSIGTSTNAISAALRQVVDDPGVGSIVLDIDSPGGDVDGIDELASEIYQARKQKPITAVSNCLCASAAYYLASQCSEVVASPSSLTGSIGVYTMHEDDSAMHEAMGIKLELIKFGENKAEGNNLGPLDDSARAHLQELIDICGNAFEKAVARGRGVKQDVVHSKFGQGRVFDAKTAVKLGLADRVGTLADVLSTSAQRSISARRQAQFAATPAAKKALAAKFARMRYEIFLAENGITPNPDRRRALDGDADDCGCDCVPCDGGDCEGCDCDACECEGCSCDSAVAKAKAKKARAVEFARMRRQIEIAAMG